MQKLLLVLLKIFAILHCYVKLVQCDCGINMPEKHYDKPKYEKSLGTRRFPIPYSSKVITLREGQSIRGYCAEKFSNFTYDWRNPTAENNYDDRTVSKLASGYYSVEFKCENNSLLFLNQFKVATNTFTCESIKWRIFEAVTHFSWCPLGMGSFILARSSNNGITILAYMCYDIKQRLLHTLQYQTMAQKLDYDHNELKELESMTTSNVELGVEIFNIETLFMTYESSQQNENRQQYWLDLATYKPDSIDQSESYIQHFKAYAQLLDIIWWSNLRVGNWKRFMSALNAKLNEDHVFNIFLGTTGVVRVPIRQNECIMNATEELHLTSSTKPIPEYVWILVQPTDDYGDKEFVFVSYNSPFYYFNEKDIIFCKDICSEIPWLNKTSLTFRYALLGISFCCSVEEVRTLNILNGFPVGDTKKSTQRSTTTPKSPSNTTAPTKETSATETSTPEIDLQADPLTPEIATPKGTSIPLPTTTEQPTETSTPEASTNTTTTPLPTTTGLPMTTSIISNIIP